MLTKKYMLLCFIAILSTFFLPMVFLLPMLFIGTNFILIFLAIIVFIISLIFTVYFQHRYTYCLFRDL